MDAGVVDAAHPPQTAAQLLQRPEINRAALAPAELLAAVDDLWTSQAAALQGTHLVHSLFLWPHLHAPDQVADTHLRAFCIGLLVSTAMIRRVVEQASIYRVR